MGGGVGKRNMGSDKIMGLCDVGLDGRRDWTDLGADESSLELGHVGAWELLGTTVFFEQLFGVYYFIIYFLFNHF